MVYLTRYVVSRFRSTKLTFLSVQSLAYTSKIRTLHCRSRLSSVYKIRAQITQVFDLLFTQSLNAMIPLTTLALSILNPQ